MDVRLRGKIGPRTPTLGPIYFRLRLFKLSRLLRCVYPALLSGLERIWPPHTHPLAQSIFASGYLNSLACFAALERI